ncbi:MAG: MlrC C-terminal domain-containing protein, partial [Pseudomonadota bacterium]
VPLLTPQVSQLTATNEPYGQLMQAADEQLQQEGMLTNSLLSGFAFGDTPHNGFWSYACARTQSTATKNAQKMAQAIWEKREAFRRHLLSVDEAVQLAGQTPPSLGPRLFADVADNPGGGAAGNTMWLIDAFLKADIQNVIAGIIHDPLVVKDAHEAGVGAKLTVRFNRENPQTFSEPLTAEGEVIWVGSGDYQSSMGVYKGSLVPLGPSCVLQIKGIKIIVVTVQQQLLGNDCFHHFGLEAKDAHSVIIKSRGHFRAGFKGVTSEDNIYEVDAPGLTTANLAHVDWQNLTRPIALLDEMDWTPGEGYLFPPRDSLKFSASR